MPLYKQDCNKIKKHSPRTPPEYHLHPIFTIIKGFFPSRKYQVKKKTPSVGSRKTINMKAAGETSPCTQPHVPAHWMGKEEPIPTSVLWLFQSGFLSFLPDFNTLKQTLEKNIRRDMQVFSPERSSERCLCRGTVGL